MGQLHHPAPGTDYDEAVYASVPDIIQKDEYGDWDDEEAYTLDGHDLVEYESEILEAIVANRMPEEAERGIMNWYHEPDCVNDKVQSVALTVEEREGQLWGVAECMVRGQLEPDELETLKDSITGQCSDGWGGNYEQHEIDVGDERLYVHLWGADSWELKTELDRLGPELRGGTAGDVLHGQRSHRSLAVHWTG